MRPVLAFAALLFCIPALAQEKAIKAALADYFASYTTSYTSPTDRCRIEKVNIDKQRKKITIHVNELFSGQSFSQDKVELIYKEIESRLPAAYSNYAVTLMGGDYPIEQLVTDIDKPNTIVPKRWTTLYSGPAWASCTDKPYNISKGMQGRHLMVWASHGKVYKNDKGIWEWQRPLLFCTTEDILSQTIVNPFLIPMLENAGAYVCTPRERDSQRNELIVDNDTPSSADGSYEEKGRIRWASTDSGFARAKSVYFDGDNPFKAGTARKAAVSRSEPTTEARWTPNITEAGHYAVYVSYDNLPAAIPDARYTVCHAGIQTHFSVNQRMGGGTWVYLGTFFFSANNPKNNFVTLSNLSNQKGTVSADAVRFGGGMGNISRGGSTSGVPRFLEGARYFAQWAGMPYSVYAGYEGTNDYNDDINCRANMTNFLAGGSCYLPNADGLRIPIELSVALHTDAGIKEDDYIGSLGIYTTDNNGSDYLPAGLSRLTSRDLCDFVLTQVDNDLNAVLGYWRRRPMWDRNYSETRRPQVPSIILEMFSHQNFNDMRKGHDPYFKFLLARAIYKGILKYSAAQHQSPYVVQPLPVTRFFSSIKKETNQISLVWKPQYDPIEPSASPKAYVVYVREEGNDFDNGTLVRSPSFTFKAQPGIIYSFKVTALNDGGESFPSETLCTMIADNSKADILIIDAFQRLAGPQVINNETEQRFSLDDAGIPYGSSADFCDDNLNPVAISGNTFDHCLLHGTSIAAAGTYSFASASRSAVEAGDVNLNHYHIADLILGYQRDDGYSLRSTPALSPNLINALQQFTQLRGRLLVSGAYIASDQTTAQGVGFLRNILKIDAYAPTPLPAFSQAIGMNTTLTLDSTPAETLTPMQPAFTTLLFPDKTSAAVAYKDTQYSAITLGFPFAAIRYPADRDKVMRAFLKFLTQ